MRKPGAKATRPRLKATRPRLVARRTGLTLVELLVVLSIVAVLSTVALRSITGVALESRYDANLGLLEDLRGASLGDATASGFLSDIGRLPIARGGIPEEQLAELWDGDATALEPYAIRTAPGDSEVKLGTGWRGPYLDLGINRGDLQDGFANPYELFQADGTAAGNGDTVAIIRSLGADGVIAGDDFDADQTVVFQADAGAVTAGLADAETNRWEGDLSVTVYRDRVGGTFDVADGEYIVLRVYGPDGANGGSLFTMEEEKLTLTGPIPSHTFTMTGLPHGPKVIRAYQESTDPATEETPIITEPIPPTGPPTGHERKSLPINLRTDRLTPQTVPDLYLEYE